MNIYAALEGNPIEPWGSEQALQRHSVGHFSGPGCLAAWPIHHQQPPTTMSTRPKHWLRGGWPDLWADWCWLHLHETIHRAPNIPIFLDQGAGGRNLDASRTSRPHLAARQGWHRLLPGHSLWVGALNHGLIQWIGLREQLQENPIFNGKIYGSCKFSLKPIHWLRDHHGIS
jgi:hypothetical protein